MVQVVKADGTSETFKMNKLRRSLKKAGATPKEVRTICEKINSELVEGIKTEAIYRRAFELLRDQAQPTAARYSLRRALFSLGPTGFPFEDFLKRMFEAEGYKTAVRTVLQGKCVEHELDVIGYKDNRCVLVEAKFHARPGIKSDLQVALYSHSRFRDLENNSSKKTGNCPVTDAMVVTNTKFTSSAVQYAECAGLQLMGWDYPKDNNLHTRVEAAGIYPITVLSSMSLKYKRILIQKGVILCRELLDKPSLLRSIGCKERKIKAILEECGALCGKSSST